ncbi:hypothetical protein FUA23_19980 [Neolewinella aurantiaca]|uniref:Uncharacterized protein n=1 Tax=Neolewinella aurantiaca TaxID=2602767 RepID=A0A5C7FFC2_9BACT|nr:hypothetical protein [Neolewinella aurantiaca]TXF86017.1 hypothetical protein FUA23_19980 [Neolewinella aurantiaca]
MEPIRKDRPTPAVFAIMTLVSLGSYFGIKYGVMGGEMKPLTNGLLILVAMLLGVGTKRVLEMRKSE